MKLVNLRKHLIRAHKCRSVEAGAAVDRSNELAAPSLLPVAMMLLIKCHIASFSLIINSLHKLIINIGILTKKAEIILKYKGPSINYITR